MFLNCSTLVLKPAFGEYSPYNPEIGAGGNKTVSLSTEFDKEFNDFKERAIKQILQDERIQTVNNIDYNRINSNEIHIGISVIMVNTNTPISFVFPFNL